MYIVHAKLDIGCRHVQHLERLIVIDLATAFRLDRRLEDPAAHLHRYEGVLDVSRVGLPSFQYCLSNASYAA
jgi:hypothetical protein